MITLLLCEREILQKPVLYLSHYFKRFRQQYYDHLQAVRDEGAWEEWLAFFLGGVSEVSQQAAETARRILLLREQHRQVITDQFGRAAGNGHRVLEHLYQHPIVAVSGVQDLIQTSYPTANDLVGRFVTHGLLQEMTGQKRNRRFIYRDYIDLFHDGPGDEQSS
jgi:Fic family protein